MIHVRNATKKAGGQARKQGKNRKGKRRGAKKFDGSCFYKLIFGIVFVLLSVTNGLVMCNSSFSTQIVVVAVYPLACSISKIIAIEL